MANLPYSCIIHRLTTTIIFELWSFCFGQIGWYALKLRLPFLKEVSLLRVWQIEPSSAFVWRPRLIEWFRRGGRERVFKEKRGKHLRIIKNRSREKILFICCFSYFEKSRCKVWISFNELMGKQPFSNSETLFASLER